MRIHISKCIFIIVVSAAAIYFFTHIYRDDNRIEERLIAEDDNGIFDFNHKYHLNASACEGHHKYAMIITSYVGHVELRSAHRRAMAPGLLDGLGIKRVFLLAEIPTHEMHSMSQAAVADEHDRYADLLQGAFVESYRNLTLKHLMGLRWASAYCPRAKVVVKLDDDIAFNVNRIVDYLEAKFLPRNASLMGYVMRGMKPKRLKANKWFVTYAEYAAPYYPPFLSGWMYFATPAMAKRLSDAAYVVPRFWIDDVYVTGLLAARIGAKLSDIRPDGVLLEYYELLDCCLNDMMKKNVMCEYSAGPNGNDNNMIIKFSNAVNNCTLFKCKPRPSDKSLSDTCVSVKNANPKHEGRPLIDVIKL